VLKKLFSVILFSVLCASCATQPSISQLEEKTPETLLQAGVELGIDFSNPVFAHQTKCYKNPFEDYYMKTDRDLYVICYAEDSIPFIKILWTKKSFTENEFLEKFIDSSAMARKKMGILGTENKKIVFLQEKNDIFYHKVNLDSAYSRIQATFFVKTNKEHPVDLRTVIILQSADFIKLQEEAEKLQKILDRK
jgi:hypothetical protein